MVSNCVRLALENPLVPAAKWANAAFHPAYQPEGCAFLLPAGLPAQETVQADSCQHTVQIGWNF
jgi:hypothetical protein